MLFMVGRAGCDVCPAPAFNSWKPTCTRREATLAYLLLKQDASRCHRPRKFTWHTGLGLGEGEGGGGGEGDGDGLLLLASPPPPAPVQALQFPLLQPQLTSRAGLRYKLMPLLDIDLHHQAPYKPQCHWVSLDSRWSCGVQCTTVRQSRMKVLEGKQFLT